MYLLMAGIKKEKARFRDVVFSALSVALALVTFIIILWVVTAVVTILLSAKF